MRLFKGVNKLLKACSKLLKGNPRTDGFENSMLL